MVAVKNDPWKQYYKNDQKAKGPDKNDNQNAKTTDKKDVQKAAAAPAPTAANPTAAPAANNAPSRTNLTKDEGKAVIADISAEFGIDVKKAGTTKDWAAKAATDPRVSVTDANGNPLELKDGQRIPRDAILTVQSEKYGTVKIQVGGDGEINGNDDKVLSVGADVAINGLANGLGAINGGKVGAANPLTAGNAATAAAGQQVEQALCPVCKGKGCPTCKGTGYIEVPKNQAKDPLAFANAVNTNNINPFAFGANKADPVQQAQQIQAAQGVDGAQGNYFDQAEIQNLMAAIMQFGVFHMDNVPGLKQFNPAMMLVQ